MLSSTLTGQANAPTADIDSLRQKKEKETPALNATLATMKRRTTMSDVDRTIGVLAALDYLGLDFGHTPVIGRTTDKFPKRRPRRWASLATAVKMRYLKPKTK